MTLIWFVVWLIADQIGGREPLRLDPVNLWMGSLILAIALDLGRQHTTVLNGPRSRPSSRRGWHS